jgi:hypothetical protein
MIVGRNTRLGVRVHTQGDTKVATGDAWVIATLGISLDIPAKHVVRVDGDALVLRRGRSVLTAYSIGLAWATELARDLDDRVQVASALGPVTVGIVREQPAPSTPIAKLQRAVRELLPQPTAGTQVIVLARATGALVIELGASTDPFVRDRWLAGLRRASPRELRTAEPPRIELHIAKQTGLVRVLVDDCPDPDAALQLDDPDRTITAGEPFKCTSH